MTPYIYILHAQHTIYKITAKIYIPCMQRVLKQTCFRINDKLHVNNVTCVCILHYTMRLHAQYQYNVNSFII